MTLQNDAPTPGEAKEKRKAQLESWRRSETEMESSEVKNRPKRVKFNDKCIFQAACNSNDKDLLAKMIQEGYDINSVDEDGITALHQACIEDSFDLVEFLLANGADVNISDNEGWTPLHAVATCSFVSLAKLLLEHGANVVALNNDCCIPLDICKHEEIKQLFIKDISGKGIDLRAARKGEEIRMMEDAERWIQSGKIDEKAHHITGATGLHVAACKGYIKVLDLMIKAGSDINAKDFDGWTPLHAAAHWGQKEACEVLVENNANPLIKNNNDQTPLEVAEPAVVSVLKDCKKRHDENENIEGEGGQNILPLPPRRPVKSPHDEEITVVTTLGPFRPTEPSNTLEEEVEASDVVGELPSGDVPLPPLLDLPSEEICCDDSPSPETDTIVEESQPSGPDGARLVLPRTVKIPEVVKEPSVPFFPPPGPKEGLKGESEDKTPWRRSGSLRTNKSQPEESNDRSLVRRTRSDEKSSPDVNLRRAYSFESDSKFYTRLTSARNRIKAIEEASAAMSANLSDISVGSLSSTLARINSTHSNQQELPSINTNDNLHNSEVVLRRKEADSPRSPRPTTFSTFTAQSRVSPTASNNTLQMRSGSENSGSSPSTPSTPGAKVGPVSKFKQFLFKSFVPPSRDEESETQRKAHAKRVRETRRSTQGVTLEELKSAEQYIKNNQQQGPSPTPTAEQMTDVPQTSSTAGTNAANVRVEVESSDRRPSWMMKQVDSDKIKFILEDTRRGRENVRPPVPPESPTSRPKVAKECPSPRLSRAEEGPKDSDQPEEEVKNTGIEKNIRKRKTKRRYTGPNIFPPESPSEPTEENETGGKGSALSLDLDQSGPDYSKSENGVSSRINYKKLYEEVLKENQLLKARLSRNEEEMTDLKLKMDKITVAPRISADDSEKREKRALERKLSEMEEELKESRHLRSENQKLRDENGALIRVISKLSK